MYSIPKKKIPGYLQNLQGKIIPNYLQYVQLMLKLFTTLKIKNYIQN